MKYSVCIFKTHTTSLSEFSTKDSTDAVLLRYMAHRPDRSSKHSISKTFKKKSPVTSYENTNR